MDLLPRKAVAPIHYTQRMFRFRHTDLFFRQGNASARVGLSQKIEIKVATLNLVRGFVNIARLLEHKLLNVMVDI